MSRYAYAYSLTAARPAGWRGMLANATIFAAVMAVSAISGALVTLHLAPAGTAPAYASAAVAAPVRATVRPVTSVRPATSPRPAAPATVAAAAPQPVPAPLAAAAQPATPALADSDLTFAKGYAQRRVATAHRFVAEAVVEDSKLGRPAKTRKIVARNNATTRRPDVVPNQVARNDLFGAFNRFDRPADANRRQALAYGEQHNQRTPAATRPGPGNSPGGFFRGWF
jgi:hypothetical protein